MTYSALVVGGGQGRRSGLPYNKIFYKPENQPCSLLELSIQLFLKDPDCKEVILVINSQDLPRAQKELSSPKLSFCQGGPTRADSVQAGLVRVSQPYVLVHDAVRPYLNQEDLHHLKEALSHHPAAILVKPVVDTIKVVQNQTIQETLDRSSLWAAVTPQGFQTDLLKKAYASLKDQPVTDDAQVVELSGLAKVVVVEGSSDNNKFTLPKDFE